MDFDVFYAASDLHQGQVVTRGQATTSGAVTLEAEGSTFTLTGAPDVEWTVGQIVSITGGGKTAYCRVAARATSPSQTVLLVPCQTTADSSGVVGFEFPNASTITARDVFTDVLTLVIDLSEATGQTSYYNYVFLCAGTLYSPTTSNGRAKLRILRESLVDDPLGGAGSNTIGDAEQGIALGYHLNSSPFNFVWWAANLVPGQRYEYRLLVSCPGTAIDSVRVCHPRIVALRCDSITTAEQVSEVTTTATSLTDVCATAGAPVTGSYLIAASWLAQLSANSTSDIQRVQVYNSTAATVYSETDFSPINTAEYNAFGFAAVKSLTAGNVLKLRHRVVNSGPTSRVKQAKLVAMRIPDSIVEAIGRWPGGGTNSSLTADAWNTLLDSDQGASAQSLAAGTWVEIISTDNSAAQFLRPDWASASLEDGDHRAIANLSAPGTVGTREYGHFFVNRHARPSGNQKTKLLVRTAAGVTSASWANCHFSFLRERAVAAATSRTPLAIVAEVETGLIHKSWVSAGTDKWQLDLPDVELVTRVVVNGVDYTRVTSVGSVSSARRWHWDVSTRRVTIQMDTGDSPADADRTVVLGVPLLVAREPEAVDDDDGVTRRYLPLIDTVPSVAQQLEIKGAGCEVATTFGAIKLLRRDRDLDDTIARRVYDGMRLRVWRGWRHLTTRTKDMQRLLTAPLGRPKRRPKAIEIDVHGGALVLSRPVSSTTISVYEGSVQRSDQLMPVVYGIVRRVPAYRTTDNGSGTNTFRVTSIHASTAIGAIDSAGAFQAKAYADGETWTAANTIAVTLATSTFTVADTQPDWKADALYVDVHGLAYSGPGEVARHLLTTYGGLSADQLVESSFRLLDRRWRLRRKSTGVQVPLAVKVGLYLAEETVAEAMNAICRAAFAYWSETRTGRIRLGVPDIEAASLLSNGSFERDASSAWPWFAGDGASVALAPSVRYFGARGAQVSNGNFGSLRQFVVFPRAGRYAVTAVAALQSGTGESVRLSVTHPGDGRKREWSDVYEVDSSHWGRISALVDVPRGGAGTGLVEVWPYRPQGAAVAYPDSPGTLKLHLRADALSLADGDPVATWADQTGNGNNATQATASKRPTFRANAVNGLPAVFIDDIDDAMDTPLALSTPCTVVAVFAYRGPFFDGRACRVLNGTNDWYMGFYPPFLSFQILARVGSAYCPATGPDVPFFQPVVVTLRQASSSSSELFVNGVSVGTQTAGSQLGPGTLKIGLQSVSTERGGPAYLCEVLAFNTAISVTRRTTYEGLLMRKWGAAAATINVDMIRCVPVGVTISGAGDHARDAVIGDTEVSREHYYEARVPYNVNIQKPSRASAALVTEAEARGLLTSYAPADAEGKAALLASGRLDMGRGSNADAQVSDSTPGEAQKSAFGVAAALAYWFGRQRNVLEADVTGFSRVPEVGEFLYAEPVVGIPRTQSEDPLWLLTSIDDESSPAVELAIRAEREMDPVADRNLVAASEIPLGAVIECTASACPTDYEEVTSMRGFYVHAAPVADQTNVFGAPHHVHSLSHQHTLPQHQHTAKAASAALGASFTEGYATQSEEKNRPDVVFGPSASVPVSAARGPTSGDHGHSIGTGTFTANNNASGTRASTPTTTLEALKGSNDVKELRVLFCRKVAKTVAAIPSSVVLGYNAASAPAGWSRQTSFYDRAPRGADPGNTGFSGRSIGAHAQAAAGATITPASMTDVRLYQRITVTEAANTYHGIVTAISGSTFTLVPSHEAGDTADGTAYTSAATIAAGSSDVGATADPPAHLHGGSGAVPSHQHTAAHTHAGIASGAPTVGSSDAYVTTMENVAIGYYWGVSHPHGHGFSPTLPSNGGELATAAGGSLTGSGTANAPKRYARAHIYNSAGTETAVPVGAEVYWEGSACPSGWARVTEADDRLVVGAGSGAGLSFDDGGHTHPVDFSSHAYSHNHGSSYTDSVQGSTDVFKVGTDQPESTSYFALDSYAAGTSYKHQHSVGVNTISSVDPTLSAENASTTGTAAGSSCLPPGRRFVICRRQ